jgi:hypothetical protein
MSFLGAMMEISMDDKSATYKPKREARVQIAPTRTADGQPAFVLHHPGAQTYLQVDAQNYFLWQLMDGEHDLGGLAMAYFVEYHAFPFDRLTRLVQLEAKHSASPLSSRRRLAVKPRWLAWRRLQRVQLDRADEFFAGFYRAWVLFTRCFDLFGLIASPACC